MTDRDKALEAARRIVRKKISWTKESRLVARALLAEDAPLREALIEQCAKIADAWCENNHWPNGAWGIAAEIRALHPAKEPGDGAEGQEGGKT